MTKKQKFLTTFKVAFTHTLPILAGFLFLGMAYGIYSNKNGLPLLYPLITSIVIFGGSIEFISVGLMSQPFNPIQAFLLAFTINARHLLYGLSMLDKYNVPLLKKIYLIYSMCDETFSINSSITVPPNIDKSLFYFIISFLNQVYWILGATLGSLFGSLITLNTKGIEFVMTALFTVIFIEHLQNSTNRKSALIGLSIALLMVLLFRSNFIIPSMVLILIVLSQLQKASKGQPS